MPTAHCDATDAPTVSSLAELAELMRERDDADGLYVRWSRDIEQDMRTGTSRDELTGIELPGLSANSLRVEPWWGARPLTAWVARRLYDYRHLLEQRGPDTCPWVVRGAEAGRGPDNEPLITDCVIVARVEMEVLEEVEREVRRLGDDWGTLSRA
jgi:hypothetical protein